MCLNLGRMATVKSYNLKDYFTEGENDKEYYGN